MSRILNYSKGAGLQVESAEVADMNEIIFKTQLVDVLPGLTKDGGKYYRLDTKANTAVEVTAKSVTKDARKALKAGADDTGALVIAESFGLVKSITLTTADVLDACGTSLGSLLVSMNMKVTDVTIEPQNDIIFKTKGIDRISKLTKDAGKYYQLDTAKNTATLIDPQSVAKRAKKDLLKGKITDFVNLADDFNLISSITLTLKDN